jgi:alkylation response protein AidB-like acyl-CoA dehydrogenase
MDFLPSDEQQQIIDSVRGFFAAEFSLERLRPKQRAQDDGGRAQWSAIGELGFFGLGIAETHGGVGYTLAEEALLFREAGRFLLTPSLLAQVLAAHLAARAGLDPSGLLSGAERAALMAAVGPAQLGPRVSGEFQLFDAAQAQWLVTWDAGSAALIPATALTDLRPVGSIDEAVPLSRVRLDAVPATATTAAAQENLALRASLLLAAQLVGIAEATRDMAASYAKLRQQFGQPIGAFQAIKHKCADMAVRCEAAWFQTVFAALAARDGLARAAPQVAASLLMAAPAAHENAAGNLQVHGGLGYTAECDAHHFVKRARILERLAGGLGMHQRILLEA